MDKILILGVNGMLGYAVSEYFQMKRNPIIPITRKEYDIAKDRIHTLEQFLDDVNVVINCAGVIKPRIADTTTEDVIRVNSIFPRNLAKLCLKKDIRCFHITTDCVYSGRKGQYSEDDYFDPDDLYGLTKNAGETNDCMVLRTSIIGEEKGQSRSLLEWALGQAGKEVIGFTNHLWNGVTTIQLAKCIEAILVNDLFQNGTFHIYSPNIITKYKLLQIFNTVYNLNLSINPAKADTACDRSLTSLFDLSNTVCQIDIPDQIEEMKEFFSRSRKNWNNDHTKKQSADVEYLPVNM